MVLHGFRASPADHPGPSMADPRTIGPRPESTRGG
jgi:hypothetical protein